MAEVSETTKIIMRRIRALRGRHGWTASELAKHMAKVGIPWDRQIVTNVENGKRANITVNEWLALARVFDVAPIHLLIPVVDAAVFNVTPNETVPTSRARAWIRGAEPLPGTNPRTFRTEVPLNELGC